MTILTLRDLGFLGGVALWTPAQISTALWLDAADASTVTLVSGAVSQWNDKSGNNRHVVQADTTRQPTYQASGFNGLPSLDFDGSNDFLKNAAYQPSGALTCALVVNPDAWFGAFVNAQRSNGIFEVNTGFGGSYTNITFTATGAGTGLGFNVAGGVLSKNLLLIVQYDGSGAAASDYNARLNGLDQTVLSSGLLGYVSETGTTVGGRAVQNLGFYNGLISEIIIREGVTAVTESQRIEGYLAHKWGLTANLPADHPYKSSPPLA